jgi:hypothetical protein
MLQHLKKKANARLIPAWVLSQFPHSGDLTKGMGGTMQGGLGVSAESSSSDEREYLSAIPHL